MELFFLIFIAISGGANVGAFSFSGRIIRGDESFRRRKMCMSLGRQSQVGGIKGKMTEEDVLALGGDPFFLTEDNNEGEDDSNERNNTEIEKTNADPSLPQLIRKLEIQHEKISKLYEEMSETMSEITQKIGLEIEKSSFTSENEQKGEKDASSNEEDFANSDIQTASGIMSELAMAGGGGAPSILSFLQDRQSNEEEDADQTNEESVEDRMAEIEAMGGDPFFLEDGPDDSTGNKDDKMASEILKEMRKTGEEPNSNATDGKDPTQRLREPEIEDPDWEWDGVVDEDAHFDFY